MCEFIKKERTEEREKERWRERGKVGRAGQGRAGSFGVAIAAHAGSEADANRVARRGST